MKALHRRIVSLSAILILTLLVVIPVIGADDKAAPPMTSQKDSPIVPSFSDLPPAELTIGGHWGSDDSDGSGDVLIPIARVGSGLLFVNPRASYGDSEAEEYNIGGGYRYLLAPRNMIFGANVYYDHRHTDLGSTFHQWGAGVEYLSDWVDARANYYWPDKDKQIVNQYDVENSSSYSTPTTVTMDPYAQQNSIYQGQVTTLRTTVTTTKQHFEQYEEAMEGWDAEVGVKLPIPRLSDLMDVKVFGGYYDFFSSFSSDIQGFKGRLEIKALPSLYLDAEVYDNKDLTGSDYYFGARMRVPFDVASISKGKNPFAGTIDGFNPKKQPPFASRLTEMVMRDPQIRTEVSQFEENTAKSQTTVDSFIQSQTTNRTTIKSDITFVNSDNHSGMENGTAEHPYDTINRGVSNVIHDFVYVFNASTPYDENVTVGGGITLWGSGCKIPALNGKSFGSGIAPIVDGVAINPTITVGGNNVTVHGFEITHSGPNSGMTPDSLGFDPAGVGIYGHNVTGTDLGCNNIHNTTRGILLDADTVPQFTASFEHNSVSNSLAEGVNVTVTNASTVALTFDGNNFSDNGGPGLFATIDANDLVSITIRNQVADTNIGGGLVLNVGDHCTEVDLLIDPTTVDNNLGPGIVADIQADNAIFANFAGVEANNNLGPGLDVNLNATNGGVVAFFGPNASLFTAINEFTNLMHASMPSGLLNIAASGPITATNDVGGGIVANLQGDDAAIGTFFDITANDNLGPGINANISSPNGGAVALFSSSGELNGLMKALISLANNSSNVFVAPSFPDLGPINANGNVGPGIVADLQGDTALAGFAGINAYNNIGGGIDTTVHGVDGMGIAGFMGINAISNIGDGVYANVHGSSIGAAAFVNVHANDNAGNGVDATVKSSNGIAVALFASADALPTLAYMINATTNVSVPIDVSGIAPFGPFEAQGNLGNGIDATVQGENAALGAFIDIHANDNGGWGINSHLTSTNGAAGALYGSSDQLFTLLGALGSTTNVPLFGQIQLPPNRVIMGNMQVDGNGGGGINADLTGENEALAGFLGIDAIGNGGRGISSTLASGNGSAVAAYLWVNAVSNDNDGIRADLSGRETALSLFADIHANDNSGDGVHASVVSSNNEAVALFASTDPLTTALQIFNSGTNADLPFDLSGLQPFGPFEAQDNGGNGINATVQGEGTTLALFMDIRANDNGNWGIKADVQSISNTALAAFGSSDVLLNLLGAVATGETNIPIVGQITVPPFTPMGNMEVNGNSGGGINLNLQAQDSAVAGFGGLDVIGNGGKGINVNLNSYSNSAVLGVAWVNAVSNSGAGIDVNGSSLDSAELLFLGVNASQNGNRGIDLTFNSTQDSVDGIFLGVNANGNNGTGIRANLQASNDVTTVFSAVNANDNLGDNGIHVIANAGDYAESYFGTNAADEANGESLTNDLPASLIDLIPAGAVTAQGNSGNGIVVSETAIHNAELSLKDVNASSNGTDGVKFTSTSLQGGTFAWFDDVTVSSNGSRGLDVSMTAYGPDGQSWASFTNITANQNVGDGIYANMLATNSHAVTIFDGVQSSSNGADGIHLVVEGDGGTNWAYVGFHDVDTSYNLTNGIWAKITGRSAAELNGDHIVSAFNGNRGVRIDASSVSNNYYLDLGDGVYGSPGQNSIYSNGVKDVQNAGGGTIQAQSNWWGRTPPINSQFQGSINRANWLTFDPNGP